MALQQTRLRGIQKDDNRREAVADQQVANSLQPSVMRQQPRGEYQRRSQLSQVETPRLQFQEQAQFNERKSLIESRRQQEVRDIARLTLAERDQTFNHEVTGQRLTLAKQAQKASEERAQRDYGYKVGRDYAADKQFAIREKRLSSPSDRSVSGSDYVTKDNEMDIAADLIIRGYAKDDIFTGDGKFTPEFRMVTHVMNRKVRSSKDPSYLSRDALIDNAAKTVKLLSPQQQKVLSRQAEIERMPYHERRAREDRGLELGAQLREQYSQLGRGDEKTLMLRDRNKIADTILKELGALGIEKMSVEEARLLDRGDFFIASSEDGEYPVVIQVGYGEVGAPRSSGKKPSEPQKSKGK
jgi:hypothetical protein